MQSLNGSLPGFGDALLARAQLLRFISNLAPGLVISILQMASIVFAFRASSVSKEVPGRLAKTERIVNCANDSSVAIYDIGYILTGCK